jgi:flagellar biosynthesis protein FliR
VESWFRVDAWALVFALARIAPAVLIVTVATSLALPRTALGIVVLVLAVVVAEGLSPAGVRLAEASWPARWLLLTREVSIGAVLGVVAAVPLAAIAVAGQWSAAVAGDVADAEHGGLLFRMVGALVYFATCGHLALVAALGDSYRVLPVLETRWLDASAVVHAGAALIALGVAMATPLFASALIATLVVGAVERAVGLWGGIVPELALRRLVLGVTLAAAMLAIALAVAGDVRQLPALLARRLAGY